MKKNQTLPNELTKVIYIIRGVSANIPFGFTCLPQALTLKYFLASDETAKLIIGVNKGENNDLEAHAWVEQNQKYLIGDTPFQKYVPLWEWS